MLISIEEIGRNSQDVTSILEKDEKWNPPVVSLRTNLNISLHVRYL